MLTNCCFDEEILKCALYAINLVGGHHGASLKEIRGFLFGYQEALLAKTVKTMNKRLPKILKSAVNTDILQYNLGKFKVKNTKQVYGWTQLLWPGMIKRKLKKRKRRRKTEERDIETDLTPENPDPPVPACERTIRHLERLMAHEKFKAASCKKTSSHTSKFKSKCNFILNVSRISSNSEKVDEKSKNNKSFWEQTYKLEKKMERDRPLAKRIRKLVTLHRSRSFD